MITFTTEIEFEDLTDKADPDVTNFTTETVLEIDITARLSPYVPAKINGPPEKCYPAEGGEIEDWSAEFTNTETGYRYKFNLDDWLTDAALQRIVEQVYKEAENQ